MKFVFGHAKRWYDSVWWSLSSTVLKSGALLILVLITFTLFTDVGWADAIKAYGSNLESLLIFARAGGTPNGAHLLSYIPLPLLGGWVAWKFRKDDPGNSYLGAVYLGILVVGFGLAIHELLWIIFYFIQYYGMLALFAGSNFIEDIFFSVMCLMLIVALWKYPFRKLPMKTFLWPSVAYLVLMFVWWAYWGLPVSTINNYQFGQGVYETTKWWADPFVNGVEIFSWNFLTAGFWLAIWWHGRHHA